MCCKSGMSDEIKHECAVALVVLRKGGEHYRNKYGTSDYGGVKLSLLLEKQHNRGQDGAGVAIVEASPEAGSAPYHIFKSASATPLADVLSMLTKRGGSIPGGEPGDRREDTSESLRTPRDEKIFLGHLRYATFGKNEEAFCHPFVHASSELCHTLLLAGNFNLTNAAELFDDYRHHGSFPTSKADGYLITELVAHELQAGRRLDAALANALRDADGAWTLVGATADGMAFATRDPHGIRPGWYYVNDEVAVVASERPAIQAAFDVPPEEVKELPPGEVLIVSPEGEVVFERLSEGRLNESTVNSNTQTLKHSNNSPSSRPCAFERIYFSRANDADIHRERKALGAALVPQILKAADSPLKDIFFSYIPNSARIAFHGLLEEMFRLVLSHKEHGGHKDLDPSLCELCGKNLPRFGEIAVKDAKFRTFIADAAARREFYKHVYDVTYGLVGTNDTLVVLDDSIVRGNTMKNAILPMLDRLGPKRIVVASSAPPIRYPDCYGIDMSTLGELVAFRALVNLLDNGERGSECALREALVGRAAPCPPQNPLASLYARFSEEEHAAEIARLLTPPGMKAEVVVVYQTVEALRKCLQPGSNTESNQPSFAKVTGDKPIKQSNNPTIKQFSIGDWYFTGDYPTPGGYRVLHKALENYLARKTDRSY